jgi:hypothetical protein
MRVVYMAHPVSGDVEGNLAKARIFVRELETKHPDVAIVASWITECEIWNDADPEERAAGMRRDMAVLGVCHELWLVGPHVSTGMAMERDHALGLGIPVRNMTGKGCLDCLDRGWFTGPEAESVFCHCPTGRGLMAAQL